jgi:hypothetical protein
MLVKASVACEKKRHSNARGMKVMQDPTAIDIRMHDRLCRLLRLKRLGTNECKISHIASKISWPNIQEQITIKTENRERGNPKQNRKLTSELTIILGLSLVLVY